MNITLPKSVKKEIDEHPEINWSGVASKAFIRQLQAQKVLDQFAEPDVSEDEAIERALRVQHRQKVIAKEI